MPKIVEMMMKLFTEYGLTKEDTFKHQHYSIIQYRRLERLPPTTARIPTTWQWLRKEQCLERFLS